MLSNRDRAKYPNCQMRKNPALPSSTKILIHVCMQRLGSSNWCRSPVLTILSDFRLVLSPAEGLDGSWVEQHLTLHGLGAGKEAEAPHCLPAPVCCSNTLFPSLDSESWNFKTPPLLGQSKGRYLIIENTVKLIHKHVGTCTWVKG